MLSTSDITNMRATLAQSLPGTAVIQAGTLTSDGGGGYSEAFSAAETVACRVAPLTGTEREVGGRVSSEAEYVITLPAETTVETDDRIVVGGITYNVVAVRDRSWEISRRVEVRKVA
jgi:head-tail adaptor